MQAFNLNNSSKIADSNLIATPHRCQPFSTGETHLNFLLHKKENRAKFVIIFLGVVGWVERESVNNC